RSLGYRCDASASRRRWRLSSRSCSPPTRPTSRARPWSWTGGSPLPEDGVAPLRVALVGAGLQGHRRAQALRGGRPARLTVVSSKDPERARELADEYAARAVVHW